MKLKAIYSLLIGLLIFAQLHAQRKLTEATISYDITITTSAAKPKAADAVDGSISVIYLKANSSRTEMITPLGQPAYDYKW
jgi:hypothetical protein